MKMLARLTSGDDDFADFAQLLTELLLPLSKTSFLWNSTLKKSLQKEPTNLTLPKECWENPNKLIEVRYPKKKSLKLDYSIRC